MAFEEEYQTLRQTFASQKTKSIKWRKWQLKQLWWLIKDNEERFLKAFETDLGRSAYESSSFELKGLYTDILRALTNVDKWAAGHAPEGAGFLFGTIGKAWLRKEPLGVALVIGVSNGVAPDGGLTLTLPRRGFQLPSVYFLRAHDRRYRCRLVSTSLTGGSFHLH
jgi:acyl-CoA reductase-like NAD-dependent aldehyde dehydrogenase